MTSVLPRTENRSQAYVLAPGELRRHQTFWPGVKADSSDTAGLLGVFEDTIEPGQPGPPLHMHTNMDEAFYVLEGALLVRLGDQQREVTAGCFVWIPRGTPHAFANASGHPTRMLGLAIPGGIEDFFADQQRYFDQLQGPPDPAILGQMGARHGSDLLGPPIQVAAPAAPHS